MTLHHYRYKKTSLFSKSLEIKGKNREPEFLITVPGLLSRHYEIKHIPSGTILWKCKKEGIFFSGAYRIKKPGQGASYKITPESIISNKFALNFAGIKLKWKYKTLFNRNLVATVSGSNVRAVEMTRKSVLYGTGIFSINLSALAIERAAYYTSADALDTEKHIQIIENDELNLVTLLLLTTYILYQHIQKIKDSKRGSTAADFTED